MKFFLPSALLALTLTLCGCPSSNVDQTVLQKAATASEQAVGVVQSFQQGEILTYNQGKTCVVQADTTKPTCVVISDEDHLFIQQSLKAVFQLDKTVNICIGAATSNAAASTCASSAIVQLEQLQADGTLHIKSPEAKQGFSLAIGSAKGALNIISTMLGGQ